MPQLAVPEYVYWSAATGVLKADCSPTNTSTVPTPGGDTACKVVGLTNCTPTAGVHTGGELGGQNVTVGGSKSVAMPPLSVGAGSATGAKRSPVMVTVVPPALGPWLGDTLVTTGVVFSCAGPHTWLPDPWASNDVRLLFGLLKLPFAPTTATVTWSPVGREGAQARMVFPFKTRNTGAGATYVVVLDAEEEFSCSAVHSFGSVPGIDAPNQTAWAPARLLP